MTIQFNDIVNGVFEFVGGILLWVNVRQLRKDKEFKGISILPTTFFMTWGYWNLYFYPSVGAWWSFFGGLNVVVANTVWVILMFKYRKRTSI